MAKATEAAKDVAVAEERLPVAAPDHFDDGLGELDSSDLIIPRLIVAQANSPVPEDAKGLLYCEVTGDAHEEMRLAVIKLTKSRILFPEKYSKGNEPLCRSYDFKSPADDIEGTKPMCDTCELLPGDKKKHKCEYANWGSGSTPPRCNEVWNLLVVDLESYLPMWFSLKSTALKPVRKIISAAKMRSAAKRIPVWGFAFDVIVETRQGDSGDSYVPAFSNLVELDPHDRANMDIIRDQLAGEEIKNVDVEYSGSSEEGIDEDQENF